jgi:PPOX class probable F420-dependent enzyme
MRSLPDSHADLLDARGVASLSTLGADEYPQVTAIWFMREGDTIVTSLTASRQKSKNLARHPKATLFLLDPTNPYRTVEIRGDVTIEDDPGLTTLQALLAKYGTDLDSFSGPKEDRRRVTLTPHHVVANG